MFLQVQRDKYINLERVAFIEFYDDNMEVKVYFSGLENEITDDSFTFQFDFIDEYEQFKKKFFCCFLIYKRGLNE